MLSVVPHLFTDLPKGEALIIIVHIPGMQIRTYTMYIDVQWFSDKNCVIAAVLYIHLYGVGYVSMPPLEVWAYTKLEYGSAESIPDKYAKSHLSCSSSFLTMSSTSLLDTSQSSTSRRSWRSSCL